MGAEPIDYPEPPVCRGRWGDLDCGAWPVWEATTGDIHDQGLQPPFTDYLCSRHLISFLYDWGPALVTQRKGVI